jgi:hypothetical protein
MSSKPFNLKAFSSRIRKLSLDQVKEYILELEEAITGINEFRRELSQKHNNAFLKLRQLNYELYRRKPTGAHVFNRRVRKLKVYKFNGYTCYNTRSLINSHLQINPAAGWVMMGRTHRPYKDPLFRFSLHKCIFSSEELMEVYSSILKYVNKHSFETYSIPLFIGMIRLGCKFTQVKHFCKPKRRWYFTYSLTDTWLGHKDDTETGENPGIYTGAEQHTYVSCDTDNKQT